MCYAVLQYWLDWANEILPAINEHEGKCYRAVVQEYASVKAMCLETE
jgi:hypothetical protein